MTAKSEDNILFEIPLTNRARSLLRLERIFRETKRHIELGTPSAHYYVLKQIFVLIDFFDRGDFKAEIIKALDKEISYFAKLKDNPAVDLSKLQVFIKQLDQLNRWAKTQRGKLGHQLLQDDFLASAQKKLNLASARLSFDAPGVKLFLTMDADYRKHRLTEWMKTFKGVQTTIEVILRLRRETGRDETVFAEDGHYQEEMEKNQYQFIAVSLPVSALIYPEVSAGPTRFSIHFKQLDESLSSQSFERWFDFQLTRYR